MPSITLVRRPVALVAVIAVAALLTACSTGSPSAKPSPTGASTSLNPLLDIKPPVKVASIAAMVPADLRAKSEIIVGLDPSLPPKEFLAADGTTIQGVDPDLVYAVGDVLGLKMTIRAAAFATLIPGAQNGRYDLLNSSMGPTITRQKVLDFVANDTSGEQLLVKAADAQTYKSLGDLCGKPVAAVAGALEIEDLNAQSVKCTAAGKQPITNSIFPDGSAANLALSSGRVVAAFFDMPLSAYQAKASKGALVNSGPIYRAGYDAFAMAKGTGFDKAIAAALDYLIKTGVYKAIFTKWGMPASSMLDKGVINPPQAG
jgi:polar amino acid transport system substrate-binding protein